MCGFTFKFQKGPMDKHSFGLECLAWVSDKAPQLLFHFT